MVARASLILLIVLLILGGAHGQHNVVVPFFMEVHRQIQEDARCEGMNMTSIMMTATTSATFEFTEQQRHGIRLMEGVEDNTCLLSKLITVCLDEGCEKLCSEKRVAHCTRYTKYVKEGDREESVATKSAPVFESGSHGTESWRALTHIKWELISTAFKLGAGSVLWMDADMLLLKNPYIDLADRLTDSAILHMTNYESPSKTHENSSCSAPVHTGFMLLGMGVKNFKYRVIQLAEHMLEINHKEDIMKGRKLEQEVLAQVMAEVDVTHCALPKLHYTGACQHAHDDGVRVQDVVIYHANCGQGQLTRDQQLALIRHMLGHKAQPDKHTDMNPFDPPPN